MKLIFRAIVFLFLLSISLLASNKAFATSCSTDTDCPARHACVKASSSTTGVCSVRLKCLTNDDCPNNKACVGARQTGTCMDAPFSATCQPCVSTAVKSNYYIPNSSNANAYFDIDCLQNTLLGQQLYGGCDMNGLAEAICHANKLARGQFARYLVLIAVITLGFNILITGKFNPNILFAILLAIALIFGGFQIINIITGMNSQSC